MEAPFTLNSYGYCWNAPMGLVDLDGKNPVGDFFGYVGDAAVDFWNNNIYGKETVAYETGVNGLSYKVKTHYGGNIIVREKGTDDSEKWSINASIGIPKSSYSLKSSFTINPLDISSWKIKNTLKHEDENKIAYVESGITFDKRGMNYIIAEGGGMDSMPIPLPDGKTLDSKAVMTWELSTEQNKMNWTEIAEAVSVLGAIVLGVVIIVDDVTGIGVMDDPIAGALGDYVMMEGTQLLDRLSALFTEFPQLEYSFQNIIGCSE